MSHLNMKTTGVDKSIVNKHWGLTSWKQSPLPAS